MRPKRPRRNLFDGMACQWRYQPTLLNGDLVEIDTTILVNFTLQP